MPYLPIEIALQLRPRTGDTDVAAALSDVSRDHASIRFMVEGDTGLTILQGDSEAQMAAAIESLRSVQEIDVVAGGPQAAYRETITRSATIDYTHTKTSGRTGEFARVKIAFEPLPAGQGFVFENAVVGGAVPDQFVEGVERGLSLQKEAGLLAGFPLIDVKATLVDGAYHDMDSTVRTFEIAARAALRQLATTGDPKLLEPVMKVEVVTPGAYTDVLVNDFKTRRGHVLATEARGDVQFISATVPVSAMFGYAHALRALSAGRASFEMTFAHFADVDLGTDPDGTFTPGVGQRTATFALVNARAGETLPPGQFP